MGDRVLGALSGTVESKATESAEGAGDEGAGPVPVPIARADAGPVLPTLPSSPLEAGTGQVPVRLLCFKAAVPVVSVDPTPGDLCTAALVAKGGLLSALGPVAESRPRWTGRGPRPSRG